MNGKQFHQQQKLDIVNTAKDIGFEKAADIAGVHYTTVYEWKRQIEAMGEDAFLAYRPSRPGRGQKEISEKQEKLVLDTWKANPGYGPGQVRNQLRRQGETVSMRTVRLLMEANGYKGRRTQDKKKACQKTHGGQVLKLEICPISCWQACRGTSRK